MILLISSILPFIFLSMISNISSFFMSVASFLVFFNQLRCIIRFIYLKCFITIKEINVPNAAAKNVLTAHRTKIYFNMLFYLVFLLLDKPLDHYFVLTGLLSMKILMNKVLMLQEKNFLFDIFSRKNL